MQSLAEEVTLAVLPGDRDDEQVEIVLCQAHGEGSQAPGEGSYVELRQQTWGEGIGWFTQSRVKMAPQQVADLRAALGAGSHRPGCRELPRAFSRTTPGAFTPRVVHADSA
ncbi:MAG: hypothetical protein KY475_11670 [Planctomycetes bacterium]|nr:hypothetical protein [Planctomycetota bacterium]